MRPAVPLQEDPRALVAQQQPQLRSAVGGRAVVGHLQLQPAQFFVRKRSSEKSEVLVTLEAKSCGAETVPEVVRNVCLYHPNSFGFLVPKPCKTGKFFNPLNVFSMSPVFVTTPFLVQKALKTENSEKCVFLCPASKVQPGPPNSLVFRRKPAPGVCSAPKSVFCLEKPANSSPLSLSPPKSRQPAEAQPRVSQCLTRQPAEVFPRNASAR